MDALRLELQSLRERLDYENIVKEQYKAKMEMLDEILKTEKEKNQILGAQVEQLVKENNDLKNEAKFLRLNREHNDTEKVAATTQKLGLENKELEKRIETLQKELQESRNMTTTNSQATKPASRVENSQVTEHHSRNPWIPEEIENKELDKLANELRLTKSQEYVINEAMRIIEQALNMRLYKDGSAASRTATKFTQIDFMVGEKYIQMADGDIEREENQAAILRRLQLHTELENLECGGRLSRFSVSFTFGDVDFELLTIPQEHNFVDFLTETLGGIWNETLMIIKFMATDAGIYKYCRKITLDMIFCVYLKNKEHELQNFMFEPIFNRGRFISLFFKEIADRMRDIADGRKRGFQWTIHGVQEIHYEKIVVIDPTTNKEIVEQLTFAELKNFKNACRTLAVRPIKETLRHMLDAKY